MRTVRVGFAELGRCPAAVRMADGVIEINADVWDRYDDFEKAFILAHEEGHYRLQTDSETEADAYALHKCYRKTDRSLKRSIETLYKVGIVNEERYNALYTEALKLDWQANGNEKAKKELEKLNITKMNNKMTLSTTPFVHYRRMDGEQEMAEQPAPQAGVCPRPVPHTYGHGSIIRRDSNGLATGIAVMGFYLSWETVAIVVTSAILLCRLKKQ